MGRGTADMCSDSMYVCVLCTEQYFGSIEMSPDIAEEIVHALREKSSKAAAKASSAKAKTVGEGLLANAAAMSEDDDDLPAFTDNAVDMSDLTMDFSQQSMAAKAESKRRKAPVKGLKDPALMAAGSTAKSDDSMMVLEDDIIMGKENMDPELANGANKAPKVRRRKNLVENEVNPELKAKKPLARTTKKKSPGIIDDMDEEDAFNISGEPDLESFSQSDKLKAPRKSRAAAGTATKPRKKNGDNTGLTPGLSSINLALGKPTPERHGAHLRSPFPIFSPNLGQRDTYMRTGMTPYDHHLPEFADYGMAFEFEGFSPNMFASPMVDGGLGLGRDLLGSSLRSRSLSNLSKRDDLRLSNFEASPRTKASVSLLQQQGSAQRVGVASSSGALTSTGRAGEMLPPAPVNPRLTRMDDDEEDDHDDAHVGEAALDISQIDANPDFANSPDSMSGADGNASLNNLSFASAHSPDMLHFATEGTTPFYQQLFSSEEKPRLHKRKLAASHDEDDDDAMTGARLVSAYQETPSRLQHSFR